MKDQASRNRSTAASTNDDVTLRGIARAAGVALQTVVNHFGTKEALFLVAAERAGEAIAETRWAVAAGDVEAAIASIEHGGRTGTSTS